MTYIREKWNNADSERFAIFFILCATGTTILFCFSSGMSGNDFWWHIKAGEYIVVHRHIPKTDIFSWYGTELQIPWVAHEWLAEVFFYVVFSRFGEAGIFFFSLAASFALAVLLWRRSRGHAGRSPLLCGVYFCLFGVCSSIFFYGRPHVFSFFLLFSELHCLYAFSEDNESNAIAWIPAIAVAWSNLHGGSSSLSYLLCLLFLALGMFEWKIGRIQSLKYSKKGLLRLGAVTVLTVVCLLINPLGVKVLLYPYSNLSDKLSMALISEWNSPDAKEIGQAIVYYLPIVVMMFAMISFKGELPLRDVAVMFAFVFLFLRSVRFIILWYIAAPFCALPYLPNNEVRPFRSKMERLLVTGLTLLLMIPIGLGVREIAVKCREGELISKEVSQAALDVVKTSRPSRLFNDYNLGGILIFNEVPVFFDSRADLFLQPGTLTDGICLMLLEQVASNQAPYVDPPALFEKYGIDTVFILKNRPLYSYLCANPAQYTCLYEDEAVGYFQITLEEAYEQDAPFSNPPLES